MACLQPKRRKKKKVNELKRGREVRRGKKSEAKRAKHFWLCRPRSERLSSTACGRALSLSRPFFSLPHSRALPQDSSSASEEKEASMATQHKRTVRGPFFCSSLIHLSRLLARSSSFFFFLPLSFPRCSHSSLRRKEETILSNVQWSVSEQKIKYKEKKNKKNRPTRASTSSLSMCPRPWSPCSRRPRTPCRRGTPTRCSSTPRRPSSP